LIKEASGTCGRSIKKTGKAVQLSITMPARCETHALVSWRKSIL